MTNSTIPAISITLPSYLLKDILKNWVHLRSYEEQKYDKLLIGLLIT